MKHKAQIGSAALTFWFIRHKPSGHYLPEPTGRMRRGGSHTEPVSPDQKQPRVFMSELSAKRALSSWLRGKVHRNKGYDSYTGDYWEDNEIVPVPSRKKDEMEIVNATMVLP